MDPVILEPGAGEGSDERKTKVSSADLGVIEFDVDKDSVDDHTHEQDETFYVLEGRMTFRADGQKNELGAGGFVFVPRGTRHGFEHDEPARYLVVSTPGGLEKYFAATEAAEDADADDDELDEIARSFGTRFLD